jgi:V/A-type H+/Na+-transporting ATPase subunit A
MISGKITRISGPIVQAEGMAGSGLYDVVQVGEAGLVGEIVRLSGDVAMIQVYEENTGMKLGEKAVSTGEPLSVLLGPGLIGRIYDGIQRPLRDLYGDGNAYLLPGVKSDSIDLEKLWDFKPSKGEIKALGPGSVLGTVQESSVVEHRVLFPPLIKGTRIEWLAEAGAYKVGDPIARTELGEDICLCQRWPVRRARPYRKKLGMGEPLITGLRVIDVLFPISKGGTAAIPGGFGTGKTMTQHAIAKWCDADIIVYIGCGERGNEMTDVLTEFPKLIDPRSGKSLMERTILIANTSNMPVAAREVSIYTGVTLAEYYRDMGYDVAVMADSTSRWAEALRELGGRMEEMPAEEGFPAYLATRLAEFYERGGRVETLSGDVSSISIIGAVSPPGGDFSEPVTQHTRRFIRCFWALDRDLANSRHYPAISWTDSYSEYAQEIKGWWDAVDPAWSASRAAALDLLKREQRLAQIVKLIGPDALPDDQRLVLMTAEMIKNGFLAQNSYDQIDRYSIPSKQIFILRLIMEFHEKALAVIKAGAPLVKISSLPVRESIVRLKSAVANEDPAGLAAVESQMLQAFESLERLYKGAKA